jgi:ubiquitin carboxyl-terminal hydrolase 5/13
MPQRSKYPLLTIISHYVAFIRKQLPEDEHVAWVLFNDEKVVKAVDVEEMKKFAYVYFFKRL